MKTEVTMTTSMAFTARSFFLRLALGCAIVLAFALLSRAGGPKCVAGTSFFDTNTAGHPLVWSQGFVTYYTDQGDLSPILPNTSANSFVDSAFAQWTSVSTAALSASRAGQLAEDVSGTNVTVNSDGTISMPLDIQASATATPIGIVYDQDGSVTDALVGAGAGLSSQCFSNAVTGGNDNYGSPGTYLHALIVINGQCAQQSSQLTDVEYRLVRVIGSVLGIGWSQVNPNVITGSPHPTSDDYAGFPVMHYSDPPNCIPITRCYAAPYQLAMDDASALARLYRITAQNQSSFPGKQVFSATMARIHGSVWFTDTHGNRTQAMQGVNVVARLIDSYTGLPSRRYAASSVSGFLFTGEAGNSITGYTDAIGYPLADWGSRDQSVEGFFDLAGLQLPNGGSAQYQLTVEPLDSLWSVGVGPYSPGPVAPSGVTAPITVTVTAGADVQQDIVMGSTAQPIAQAASSWTAPATVPLGGDWIGTLSGYGTAPYFSLTAQANRTLSVGVTSLDEAGRVSLAKAQPVIGMWDASDAPGTAPPAFTPSPFNQTVFGLTRLDAQINVATNFLVGIADVRGDGRPDYRYHAHILYADSISPSRIGVTGGIVTVKGIGFSPGLIATAGSTNVNPLSLSAGEMVLSIPPHGDSVQDISITDPTSGATSLMTGALTFGAAPTDNMVLIGGGLNPPTPVGTQATNPVTVRVLAADGVTPVGGATIGWSAGNGVQVSACGGLSSCSVSTDQSGNAATLLTPAATGVATITATLAPGVYSPTKSVNATLYAIESASDIGVLTPYLWIAQGATVNLPLTARVLGNGTAKNKVQVNFSIVDGTGTLSSASAQTSSTGYATVTLSASPISALVQVSACVAPGNAPCATFYINPVPLANQLLQPVSGAGQVSTGKAFQPVIVRVTDSSSPPNSVIAAAVIFQTTVLRPGGTTGGRSGETNAGDSAMPVILKVTQNSTTTDGNGLASILPASGGFSAPLEVDVAVTAGINSSLDYPLGLYAPISNSNIDARTNPSGVLRPPLRIARPTDWRNKGEN